MATLGDSPCLKKTRLILKDVVDCIEQFAINQHVSRENVLNMVIEECHRVWHIAQKPFKCQIPEIDATAMIYNVNLSTKQYQMIRTLCLPYGVVFPTRNSVDTIKKDLAKLVLIPKPF